MSVPYPPAGRTTWWDRNWKWFVLTTATVLLLGFCAVVALVLAGVSGMMKSSQAYQVAVETARRDPRLVAALGQPIETGWMVTGSIQVNDDSGQAALSFPLSGPRGKAKVQLEASKSGGQWTFSTLNARLEPDGQILDLLPTLQQQQPQAVSPP